MSDTKWEFQVACTKEFSRRWVGAFSGISGKTPVDHWNRLEARMQLNNNKTASLRGTLSKLWTLSKTPSLSTPQNSSVKIAKNRQTWDIEKRKEFLFSYEWKFTLDISDDFERYWEDKDITLGIFSTRHIAGGFHSDLGYYHPPSIEQWCFRL